MLPPGMMVVRAGPGGSCSAVGSTLDLLFGVAAGGGAVLAALAALVSDEAALPTPPGPRDAAEPEAPSRTDERTPTERHTIETEGNQA